MRAIADRKVVVTAGASGLGLTIASEFVRAGAQVYVCDVNEQYVHAVKDVHSTLQAIRADVSKPEDIVRFIDVAAKSMGGIDTLINNAGIAGPTCEVADISIEDWRKTIDVNLTGAFVSVRTVIPFLRKSGSGVIINISSAAIMKSGYPKRLPYAVTKTALLGMTETLAMELGKYNIRVNSVLPGSLDNSRFRQQIEKLAETQGCSDEIMIERVKQWNSLPTLIREVDVANLVLFLCSDAAQTISGQAISVCGNFEGHRSSQFIRQTDANNRNS